MDFKIGDIHKVSFNDTKWGRELAEFYGVMPLFRIASKPFNVNKDKKGILFIEVNLVKEDEHGLVAENKIITLPVKEHINWM